MRLFELIYYIYFIIVFGAKAIGLNEGQVLFNGCIVAGTVLFVLKVLTTRTSIFEYLLTAGITLAGAITYYCSGEKGILLYFTMMLGMKAISEKKVFKMSLYILGFSFLILHLLSLSGLITELNHMYKKGGYGFLLRRSLGYPYPNTTHTTFLILIILFYYLYKEKNIRQLLTSMVITMLLNLYLYVYTVSLTGLISVSIYLAATFYFRVRKNRSKIENILIELLFPATVIFSITGPVLAKGEVFDFLNKVLHKRYEYALYYLQNEKITPFGSRFAEAPSNWYMIDNSFLYLFLQLGVVTFTIVCLLYLFWIHHILKSNKTPELAIIVTFCFIGMSDPFLFNLSCKNITFVFIGAWFFEAAKEFSKRLPDTLTKEYVLLPIGSIRINLPDISSCKIFIFAGKLKKDISENALRYVVVFAVSGLLAAGIYSSVATAPEFIYVDEAIVDPYFSNDSIEMTKEDAMAAQAAGDIIQGYDENDPTMYVFDDEAPLMEHYRRIISTGTLTATIACIALASISLIRKRSH